MQVRYITSIFLDRTHLENNTSQLQTSLYIKKNGLTSWKYWADLKMHDWEWFSDESL